jgi:hypothetical protein
VTGGWQGGGHKVQRALRKGHERRCEKKQGLTWFARHRGTGNRSGQVRSGQVPPSLCVVCILYVSSLIVLRIFLPPGPRLTRLRCTVGIKPEKRMTGDAFV